MTDFAGRHRLCAIELRTVDPEIMAVKKRQTIFLVGGLTASIVLALRSVALFKLLDTTSSSESSSTFISTFLAPSSGREAVGDYSNGSDAYKSDQTTSSVQVLPLDEAEDQSRDDLGVGIDAARNGIPTVDSERTLAFGTGQFGLGFRNSAMAFTWFVMYACENNFTSIVVESLKWEDFYGRGRYPWAFVAHSLLFDVEHWNTYYPQLPRLISINATLNSTTPIHSYGSYHEGYKGYESYSRRIGTDPVRFPKSPIEITMLRGAFRPSRKIQDHMDKLTGGSPYAALHARIEPDMQRHMYCTDKKVLWLSVVIRNIEAHFPNPGFDRLFIATNRPLLEAEVNKYNPGNGIAAENLRELNRIRDEGMWNGTVAVFEAGASYMRGSDDIFGSYVGISGAVIDYFLALQSSVFIGTEVSSFSADLIQSRFYRSEFRNYHYHPNGLRIAVTEGETQPPRFVC
jgi:hypothetical protein